MNLRCTILCLLLVAALIAPSASATDRIRPEGPIIQEAFETVWETYEMISDDFCVDGYNPDALTNVCFYYQEKTFGAPSGISLEQDEQCVVGSQCVPVYYVGLEGGEHEQVLLCPAVEIAGAWTHTCDYI